MHAFKHAHAATLETRGGRRSTEKFVAYTRIPRSHGAPRREWPVDIKNVRSHDVDARCPLWLDGGNPKILEYAVCTRLASVSDAPCAGVDNAAQTACNCERPAAPELPQGHMQAGCIRSAAKTMQSFEAAAFTKSHTRRTLQEDRRHAKQ